MRFASTLVVRCYLIMRCSMGNAIAAHLSGLSGQTSNQARPGIANKFAHASGCKLAGSAGVPQNLAHCSASTFCKMVQVQTEVQYLRSCKYIRIDKLRLTQALVSRRHPVGRLVSR